MAVPRHFVLRVNGSGKDRSLSVIFRDDVAGSRLDVFSRILWRSPVVVRPVQDWIEEGARRGEEHKNRWKILNLSLEREKERRHIGIDDGEGQAASKRSVLATLRCC